MKNKVIVFMHGGPGLTSSYLYNWFDSLKNDYDLHFYNQEYADRGLGIMYSLSEQLKSELFQLKDTYSEIILLCHSWANLILLNSIRLDHEILKKVSKIIFSNPSSLKWESFNEFGSKLIKRIPENKVNSIISTTDGIEYMNKLLPYYVGDPNKVPPIVFDKYDMEAYDLVESELKGFNFTSECRLLNQDFCYSIYCDNDIETIDDSRELAENTKSFRFPYAGHFPFAEFNKEFISLLREKILK